MKKTLLLFALLLPLLSYCNDGIKCSTKRCSVLIAQKSEKASIFINHVWTCADSVSARTGIPMSIIIATSIYETGCGQSRRCVEDCNYFGLNNGKYLVFDCIEDCFARYERCIGRWGKNKTKDQWFLAIEKYWGAENPKEYVQDLKKVIRYYKLHLADENERA